jgi:hypothetical protein
MQKEFISHIEKEKKFEIFKIEKISQAIQQKNILELKNAIIAFILSFYPDPEEELDQCCIDLANQIEDTTISKILSAFENKKNILWVFILVHQDRELFLILKKIACIMQKMMIALKMKAVAIH